MVDDALAQFLQQPHMFAYYTTNGRDGYPHVTPIWYLYEDSRFYFTMTDDRQKFKNMERDNRVTICIARPEAYRNLMIKGRAQPLREDVEYWVRRLVRRYHLPENVDKQVARLMTPTRLNVVLEPEEIIRFSSGWAQS
jgi:PPOX class probable F420-dependent enzyme